MNAQIVKSIKKSDIPMVKSKTGKFIMPDEEVEAIIAIIGFFIDYRDELLGEIESLNKQLNLAKAGIKL